MADQPTGTTPATAPKKKPGVRYELVTNETGAMRRVAIGTGAAAAGAGAPAAAAAAPSAPAAAAPSAPGAAAPSAPGAAAARPPEENEDTLVFGETGELTGEEREAVLRETKEKELAAELKKRAEAAAAAAKKTRKPKPDEKIFETGTDVQKMKLFYQFRAKNPFLFTYTAEGNLTYTYEEKTGVIPLRAFSALRPEELESIEEAQRQRVLAIENEYVKVMRDLRVSYDAYKANPMDKALAYEVLLLNDRLREISVARNSALYPERWTDIAENPEIRHILLNQPYEQRKLGYNAFCFKRFGLSRQDAEGHYRQHGEAAAGGQTGGGTVVLFITTVDDPEMGIFHPTLERDFVYNETKYASPYQAYETERFKIMGNDEIVEKLLGTRSAKTIKQLVSNEPVRLEQSEKLWEEILEAFYTQFKDAADTLKETGSARFHVMDKQFGSPEYANALVNVRTKLKERENDAPAGIDEVKQSVITKDQQQKDKVGAIINNFRRRPF